MWVRFVTVLFVLRYWEIKLFSMLKVSKVQTQSNELIGINFVFVVSKFCVLGTKFCICSVEILYFRVEILSFSVEILFFRIEILYFGNQIGNFSKIQTSSLPRNTNSVTTSEPKFRHCLKIQTTSESKFRHYLRIKIW